jgi:hypothetical protein
MRNAAITLTFFSLVSLTSSCFMGSPALYRSAAASPPALTETAISQGEKSSALLNQFAALAAERQTLWMLGREAQSWNYSMDSGLLEIGGKAYRAQILGTESDDDRMFLWAWANKESQIPTKLQEAANQLRALGKSKQITALTTPSLSLKDMDARAIGLIAVGVLGSKGYYIGNAGAGLRLLLLVDDPQLPELGPPNTPTVINTFASLLKVVPLTNHQEAFSAYLSARGYQVKLGPRKLTAKHPTSPGVEADFDELGRLTTMRSTIRSQ